MRNGFASRESRFHLMGVNTRFHLLSNQRVFILDIFRENYTEPKKELIRKTLLLAGNAFENAQG